MQATMYGQCDLDWIMYSRVLMYKKEDNHDNDNIAGVISGLQTALQKHVLNW